MTVVDFRPDRYSVGAKIPGVYVSRVPGRRSFLAPPSRERGIPFFRFPTGSSSL